MSDKMIGDFSIQLEGTPQGSSGKQSWVYSLPVDQEIWNGKRLIVFTEEDLKLLQSEFIKINHEFKTLANNAGEKPYRFPVKINHNRGSGSSYGELVDIKVVKGKGLYLSVLWNDNTWEDVVNDVYKYVSVGIKPEYTTQSGNSYGPMIVELSLTEYPRVQTLGTIQDTLELRLSNIEDFEMNEETKALLEEFIMQKMQEMKEQIKSEMAAEMAEVEVEIKDEEEVAPEPESTEETPAEEAPVEPSDESPAPTDEEEEMGCKEETKLSNEDRLTKIENMLEQLVSKNEVDLSNKLNTVEKGFEGPTKTVKMTYVDWLNKFQSEGMSLSNATIKAMKMVK